MKVRLDRVALAVFMAASIIVLGWWFASWVEIISKNLNPDAVYSHWNAINILCDLF